MYFESHTGRFVEDWAEQCESRVVVVPLRSRFVIHRSCFQSVTEEVFALPDSRIVMDSRRHAQELLHGDGTLAVGAGVGNVLADCVVESQLAVSDRQSRRHAGERFAR